MNTRLKKIRNALHMNQTEMAKEMGLSQPQYSQLETGFNGIKKVYVIVLEMKFSVNGKWLMTGEGNMFRDNGKLNELVTIYKSLSDSSKLALHSYAIDLKRSEK